MTSKIIILVVVVMAISFFAINYNNLLKENKRNKIIIHQNEMYYNEVYNVKTDSIQNVLALLKNINKDSLNAEIEGLRADYVALVNRFSLITPEIIKDTVFIDTTSVTVNDSIVRVDFDGRENKVYYKGFTEYNNLTNRAFYSINIKIDTINVRSVVYRDSDGLIRNNIFADGVLIGVPNIIIDGSVYNSGNVSRGQVGIGVYSNIIYNNSLALGLGISLTLNNYYINASYTVGFNNIYYSLGVGYNLWLD